MSGGPEYLAGAGNAADAQARLAGHDWAAFAAQMDSYGAAVLPGILTASECRDVARAVRRAIDGQCTITFFQNSWDEESRHYRTTLHAYYSQEI